MRAAWAVLILLCSMAAQPVAAPATTAVGGEQRAAHYLDSIRGNAALLEAFLREMPKGADLHNHLSGAVYAENYIRWAAADGLCIDRKTLVLSPPNNPCDDAGRPAAAKALTDAVLYREMIDAFSMRHFSGALQSGHDHFFDTFGRFGAVSRNHVGAMMAEVVARAASQKVEYLELIMNPERGMATGIGPRAGWDDNFDSLRQKVDASGAADAVAASRKFLDDSEAEMRKTLGCDQDAHRDGCNTEVRYVYEVYRGLPKEIVFAQMQVGFELAKVDPRVVGINPVMPEDGYTSMTDFALHMRMFDYFHKVYPKVHITLHAGELAPGLVPPEGLRNHIRESILTGHAERIGHGVDVMQEDRPFDLLKLMHDRGVMVEINLTSNDAILGVTGSRHPLPVYMKYGVPVALSTDDEGVARSDITHEYLRAVESYKLSYAELKKLSRTGLEHGFMDDATRAALLKKLDGDFAAFERQCCGK